MMKNKKELFPIGSSSVLHLALITSLQRTDPRHPRSPLGQWTMGTNEGIPDAQRLVCLLLFLVKARGRMPHLFLALHRAQFSIHGRFCVDHLESYCMSMSYFSRSVTIS